jgi:hypothetical protein
MRPLIPLAVAAVALGVIPVPTAQAVPRAKTCDGRKTDITGGSKAETFTLTRTKRIINAHGGDDVILMGPSGNDFLEFPATVCMGSGNDTLRAFDGPEGVPVRYLDGGKGFDTAEIYICFEGEAGPKWTIRDVERITIINCLD